MWEDLDAWAANLKGPGVLVLPQPLLKTGGSKTDRTLLDFKESDKLGAIFERALAGPDPHDILILTGDIHTGRIASAEIVGLHGPDLRARRLARLARHALPAAVGPQAGSAAGPHDDQSPHVGDQGEAAAHAVRRQQHRADQDRPRPQRALSLHPPAVARAAVRRRRQARSSAAGPPRARSRSTTRSNSSSAEEEPVLRHSQSDDTEPRRQDRRPLRDADNLAFFAETIEEFGGDGPR